ncbi:MAG: TRAP transporter small permease [Granulosicoccus sp.]
MRKNLDRLYEWSGALAAALIALICLLVTLQVIFNLATKLLGSSVSLTIPSYADFAGFFLASSSFLALAYTLTRGGHIRVTLFLSRMPTGPRLVSEILSLAICSAVALFALYNMVLLTYDSLRYGDVSPGMVVIPLWVPQSIVCLGLLILSIALVDLLLQTLQRKEPVIVQHETI